MSEVDQRSDFDRRWKSDPRAYLGKRRTASNVRAGGIALIAISLLIWPPAIQMLTYADSTLDPAVVLMLRVLTVAVSLAVTTVAIRCALFLFSWSATSS